MSDAVQPPARSRAGEHERARELAAARPDGFLAPGEEAWLDAHLGTCEACTAVADAYAGQRSLFAPARAELPAPPRDLWARTSAALEREHSRRGLRRRFSPTLVYAPLAASLVVAVAVGAGMLNGLPAPDATANPAGPDATPFPMEAGDVRVLARNEAGNLELRRQPIAQVCPTDATSCGIDAVPERVDTELLSAATTWDAIISPDEEQVVVVERGDGAQGVYVLNVSDPEPVDLPGASPAAATASPIEQPSAVPVESAAPGTSTPVVDPSAATSPAPGATGPAASPGTDPAGVPTPAPTSDAPADPDPSATTGPSDAPASGDPGGSPAVTADPATSESPSVEPTAAPTAEPTPSVAVTPLPNGALEIATNVEIIGTTAAYSPDGDHFAFTARPADRSAGPDVFVWTVGDARAKAVTGDGASLFAGWLADDLLVSRLIDGAARTVILSLETRDAAPVHDDAMWRPTIGPGGGVAAWWDGTVTSTDDASGWALGDGRLLLGPWPASADDPVQALADGPIQDWQVQWDPTGSHIAVWTTTDGAHEAGTLRLYEVNEAGRADLSDPKLDGAAAYAGFSLKSGRLTWSAPAADGERTVQVLAWKGDTFGRFEIRSDGTTTVVR